MTRLLGPNPGSRFVYRIVGSQTRNAVGKTGVVYADAAGTALADIATYDPSQPSTPGSTIADSVVTVDTESMLPLFWFPDGTDVAYVSVAGGPVTLIEAIAQVSPTRTIATIAPLAGGGDLSANRTLIVAVGTATGTVAAGDDSRVTGAAQNSANLSDLASASTARTNLGLGTAAVKDVPATGDATSSQAVLGSDSRLTNARTPTDGSVSSAKMIDGAVTSAKIADDTIVDGDVSSSAGIAASKVSGTALTTANNLSELVSTATTARTNIGAAPAGRTLTAGIGLAGGGDLSADRSFAVTYGTTAGTSAQGNDGRLFDNRTPSDDSVTAAKLASGVAHQVHTTATKEILASDPQYGTPGTRAAFVAALNAAESLGKGTVVRITAGMTIDVVTGLSLSGYSVQILGAGAGKTASSTEISVIKASGQTGPVLDFSGYVSPYSFRGRATPLAGVIIQGSGIADPTKANSGLKFTSIGSCYFHDIAITDTGGPCVEMAQNVGDAVYLCDFERFTFTPPVSAAANDVPWFYANECNGNNFRAFGFRAPSGTGYVGVSGAVVLASNNSFRLSQVVLDGWWFENLHPANGGTIVSIQANGTMFREPMFYDCLKENTTDTGTSFVRYLACPAQNGGGNQFAGLVPGHETAAITIDTGIDIRQSWNTVIGPKGYRGNNVTLASGVDHCTVWLTGGYGNTTVAGWTDNSGSTNNRLIDDYLHTEVRSASWVTNGVTQTIGIGSPESAIAGAVGDGFVRTDGTPSAVLYVKSKFGGLNTGWMPVVCENLGTGNLSVNQSIPLQTNTAWKFTLLANITFTSISNARTGATLTVMLVQDATGSRVVTWPSNVKWAGGAAPTLSTAAASVDVFQFMFDGGNWRELSRTLGT